MTSTTAPSTIIPVAMTRPARDLRLAETPNYCIWMKAISIAGGKVTITTIAERNSPRNRNRMTATRMAPPRAGTRYRCRAGRPADRSGGQGHPRRPA